MEQVSYKINGEELTIYVAGRIDAAAAPAYEQAILSACAENPHTKVVLDFKNVEYISSSGIRIVLKVKKTEKNVSVINVSLEIYDIFEMTGFTEIMDIQKAVRSFSVEGCKVIGEGAKGTVYRLNQDTIIKVYKDGVNKSDIDRERELAKKAFIVGIPTALSYDIVDVDGQMGSVFELLDAETLSEVLARDEIGSEDFVKHVSDFARLLREIHEIDADDSIPPIKPLFYKWLDQAKTVLTEEETARITELLDKMQSPKKILHCDFHSNNVMIQNGEMLLIDMDTLSQGSPAGELATVYDSYVGFLEAEEDGEKIDSFLGLSIAKSAAVWEIFFPIYMEGKSDSEKEHALNVVKVLGYLRVLRHYIRRGVMASEQGQRIVELALAHLREALACVDNLDM